MLDTIGNLNELKNDYVSISNGSIDPLIIVFRLLRKKVARIFIGTDVLKCKWFWDYRLRVKFCSLFCDNWAISEWLVKELESVGIKSKLLNHENLVLFTEINLFQGE
ncbi:MAG: hypothetical protein ACFFDN_10830 [Candidatus Hodarchaeota archaeon]